MPKTYKKKQNRRSEKFTC